MTTPVRFAYADTAPSRAEGSRLGEGKGDILNF